MKNWISASLLYTICVQVLSETVAKGLTFFFGEDARETATFIEKFDKFLDALNVTNYSSGFKKLKSFKTPYHYSGDFRLKVCSVCDQHFW